MEKVVEEQHPWIFHTKHLKFLKIQTVLKTGLLFNARALKLGHFGILDKLFPLLAFFKL